jgi:uncharacterized protein YndB with AHSA1/START domain
MTTQKDFKRLVRARMAKTGEAYTAARYQILSKRPQAPGAKLQAPPKAVSPKDYAKIAGMSDEALKKKTGCTWEKWVKALDHHKAFEMEHADIAKLAAGKYKAPPWWAQTVAVGYERIRGLRAAGQQRDGSFQASKSKTYNVPVATLFDAWADVATRKKWLNGTTLKIRKATKPKSMRLDWPEGGIVAVTFFPKGAAKSYVSIDQDKLPSKEVANRIKEEWGARFEALAAVLK